MVGLGGRAVPVKGVSVGVKDIRGRYAMTGTTDLLDRLPGGLCFNGIFWTVFLEGRCFGIGLLGIESRSYVQGNDKNHVQPRQNPHFRLGIISASRNRISW